MATLVTRSGKGSPLTHAEVDANFTNLNTDKLELSGGTMTGNLSFGDNDKAIFGAGSDLQIYHDGTDSFISDQGTGRIKILGDNETYIANAANGEYKARFITDGAVELYYDAAKKFETTSTGISVTGTVTADGLTVQTTNGLNAVLEGTTSYQYLQFKNSGETENYLGFVNDNFTVTAGNTERMRIDSSGNVGIGTSSPAAPLEVSTSSADYRIQLTHASGQNKIKSLDGNQSTFRNLLFDAAQHMFETSGSERMRIDSNGNVGIGTSSPSQKLNVGLGNIQLSNNYQLRYGTNTQIQGADTYINFNVNNVNPAIRIDSSGNVGIGTVPQSHYTGYTALDLGASGSIWSNRTTSDTNTIMMANNAYLNSGATNWLRIHADEATRYEQGSGLHRWSYAASGTAGSAITWSEAMRIDSSGNLLVGLTSSTDGTGIGCRVRGDGFLAATREGTSSQPTVVFNKKTNDGEIAQFQKDGTTVGRIGTENSHLTIGRLDTGIKFQGNEIIIPWNTETNAIKDAAIQLGAIGNRFKDLYLSGGVYLGGTGSANKLDDYEEGTWTPVLFGATTAGTFSGGNVHGKYTKVGNQVTAWCYIDGSSLSGAAGDLSLSGLPFTSTISQPAVAISSAIRYALTLPSNAADVCFVLINNQSQGTFRVSYNNNVNSTILNVSAVSTVRFAFSITYTTAA